MWWGCQCGGAHPADVQEEADSGEVQALTKALQPRSLDLRYGRKCRALHVSDRSYADDGESSCSDMGRS